MGSAVARRQPSRASLSRDRILAAALRVVDQGGLDALTMRRLGTELGVEAMSLYNHIPSKDALLDGVSEQLWSEVTVPGSGDWQMAVRLTGRSIRDVGHRHPKAFSLLLERSVLSGQALLVMDRLLVTLRSAGLHDRDATHALGTIVAYATGYVMVEQVCCMGQPDVARRALAQATEERYADTARALSECDPDAQFEFGLASLIAGLASRVGRTATPPRRRIRPTVKKRPLGTARGKIVVRGDLKAPLPANLRKGLGMPVGRSPARRAHR